jgi:SAM-dependent methyltransferase
LLASAGYEVIAIDFAPAMLERAREALAPWPTAQVRQGDVTAPPLEVGEVDAIVGKNVLWTLLQPDAAIKAWAALVEPDGLIGVLDGTYHGNYRRLPVAYEVLSRLTGSKPHHATRKDNPNKEVPLANLSSPGPVKRMFVAAGLRDVRVCQLTELDRNLHATSSWLDRVTYRPRRFAVVGTVPTGKAPT